MKNVHFLASLLISQIIFAGAASAQKTDTVVAQTLFNMKALNTKGYGTIQPSFTSIKGAFLFAVKAGGGIILKNTVGIGVEANAIVSSEELEDIYYGSINDETTAVVQGYYGGLRIEPKLEPKKVLHLTFPLVIGGGILLYKTSREYYDNKREIDNDTFFYIEPGAMVEINISTVFRLGFLFSFRYVPNLNLNSTASNAFNTASFGINLAFGKY
jgi:hypothetical protein